MLSLTQLGLECAGIVLFYFCFMLNSFCKAYKMDQLTKWMLHSES